MEVNAALRVSPRVVRAAYDGGMRRLRARLPVRLRPRRLLGIAVLAMLVAAALVFGVALLRVGPVADLPARVAAFDRAGLARPVPLSGVAPVLRDAVVATEDERFYQHAGVDVVSIARALPYDLAHASLAQGASTIDEQLAKVVYLHGDDHSPWRKAKEIAFGFKIGARYSHEQALDDYLNVVYFGNGQYGFENAARRYFGLPASRLDLAQASLLAGLIQAPGLYDPLRDPSAARLRQVAVLRSMVRNGFITEEEASSVVGSRLPLRGGFSLPREGPVTFVVGAPFDWDVLAFAFVLLAGALAAYAAAGLVAPGLTTRAALRVAGIALFSVSLLTAARSMQVL
jgi:membrane peptidoglycan carboxypeptidase